MDVDLVRLLTVLGKVNPAIWDWIIPHGPREAVLFGIASKEAQVELNPQPIPPGREILFASADVARNIALAAIAVEAEGREGSSRMVSTAVDDWCGTPHGRVPIPWPGPWPFPWVFGYEGPDMDEIVPASRLVGALTFASIASRQSDGETQAAPAGGAEKLMEAAMSR